MTQKQREREGRTRLISYRDRGDSFSPWRVKAYCVCDRLISPREHFEKYRESERIYVVEFYFMASRLLRFALGAMES